MEPLFNRYYKKMIFGDVLSSQVKDNNNLDFEKQVESSYITALWTDHKQTKNKPQYSFKDS